MMEEMATELPSWVSDLRDQLATGAYADLSALSADEASAVRAGWLDIWSQVKFEPAFHERCRDRLARCIPFAVGPSRYRRLSKTASRLTLVFDPEYPERVATSLSHAIPSVCWSLARLEQLPQTLAPYLTDEPTSIDARHERLVKPLDVEHPRLIANAIDALELWMDDAFWGSSCAEDPWLGVADDLNMLSLSMYVQRFSEDDPDRFPAVACRTLWSQSRIRIEQHPRGLFVFDLRFRPAEDAETIAELNELVDMRLPLDLPLDLAASLLRGSTLGIQDILELETTGESPLNTLALRCAAAPSEPPTIAVLRETISKARGDEELLAAVASLASSYHHDGLLFEVAAVADEPLRGELISFLRPKETP
jgi:hypothetical protein